MALRGRTYPPALDANSEERPQNARPLRRIRIASALLRRRHVRGRGKRPLTIHDLGWTREEAAATRGVFGAVADDWDDPLMDVYDAL